MEEQKIDWDAFNKLLEEISAPTLDHITWVRNIVTREEYLARYTRYMPGFGIVDLPVLIREDGQFLDMTIHVSIDSR